MGRASAINGSERDISSVGIVFLVSELFQERYTSQEGEAGTSLDCSRSGLDVAQNFAVEVPDTTCEIGSLGHLYMSAIVCRKPSRISRP